MKQSAQEHPAVVDEALTALERILFWYTADKRRSDPEYDDDVMERARAVIQKARAA